MKYVFFSLVTKTYTHVGQGAADTGVIDNLIQREEPNGIPVMHASSLKGAFRTHCKDILSYGDDKLNILFGTRDEPNGNSGTSKTVYQSLINFHDARLLFLPVGALYEKPTYYATSDGILRRYHSMRNKLLGESLSQDLPLPDEGSNFYCFRNTETNISPNIEGVKGVFKIVGQDFLSSKSLLDIPHSEISMFEEMRFKDVCKYSIPVIERNCLDEDGISQNKFNEEVLPYGTSFWFFLSYPDKLPEETENLINGFIKFIQTKYVQIGANFSLSQGLCEIKEI